MDAERELRMKCLEEANKLMLMNVEKGVSWQATTNEVTRMADEFFAWVNQGAGQDRQTKEAGS